MTLESQREQFSFCSMKYPFRRYWADSFEPCNFLEQECLDGENGGHLVRLNIKTPLLLKDVCMFMLLHLNKDLDDDLLLDVMNLLDCA